MKVRNNKMDISEILTNFREIIFKLNPFEGVYGPFYLESPIVKLFFRSREEDVEDLISNKEQIKQKKEQVIILHNSKIKFFDMIKSLEDYGLKIEDIRKVSTIWTRSLHKTATSEMMSLCLTKPANNLHIRIAEYHEECKLSLINKGRKVTIVPTDLGFAIRIQEFGPIKN